MKHIKIYDLLPLLRPGFVAMDADCTWWWFATKPNADTESSDAWHAHVCDVAPLSDSFNIAPFNGDWKDSLMECGKQDVRNKETIKTPVGDIATTPVGPSDVCIAPEIKEFSFSIELINGAKISFEKVPNNAGLTDEQLTTFFEDLFSVKEIKK